MHYLNQLAQPVQAFQLPPAGEDPSQELIDFIDQLSNEHYSGRDETLDIHFGQHVQTAYPTDWLVVQGKALTIVANEVFIKLYREFDHGLDTTPRI